MRAFARFPRPARHRPGRSRSRPPEFREPPQPWPPPRGDVKIALARRPALGKPLLAQHIPLGLFGRDLGLLAPRQCEIEAGARTGQLRPQRAGVDLRQHLAGPDAVVGLDMNGADRARKLGRDVDDPDRLDGARCGDLNVEIAAKRRLPHITGAGRGRWTRDRRPGQRCEACSGQHGQSDAGLRPAPDLRLPGMMAARLPRQRFGIRPAGSRCVHRHASPHPASCSALARHIPSTLTWGPYSRLPTQPEPVPPDVHESSGHPRVVWTPFRFFKRQGFGLFRRHGAPRKSGGVHVNSRLRNDAK